MAAINSTPPAVTSVEHPPAKHTALEIATIVIAAVIGVGLSTWMQGRDCRLNVVATFIGVLFFGWLWGGWGLLPGLPLLAVLKSIADRVEAMQPVRELLSP